jgi:thiol:disulfide interchange protein DsbA
MSKSTRISIMSAALAVVLIAVAGCSSEEPPQAVDESAASAVQAPVENALDRPETPAATTAAAQPAPVEREPGRIVVAQADSESNSGRFQLGTHYQRFPSAQGTSSSPDQIEVAEVFWYGCPHCYTFDPYLENWRQNLPEDVNFVRIPAVWSAQLQVHARAFYTARALNVIDELHTAFFREIHINGNYLLSQEALADFFASHGVSADDFNAAYESFSVNSFMNRAEDLSRRYRIASVPTVIVNGKYTTDAGMAGSYEDLMELIDVLVEMERRGE